jgi:hypothetical protein
VPAQGIVRSGRRGQHEDAADGSRAPTAFFWQQGCGETSFPIQGRQEVLEVNDAGLDLDDEHRRRLAVPTDDICRASLAEVAEGPFDDDLPAGVPQSGDNPLDEGGVTGVEQAVKLRAAPMWHELDPGV